MVGSGSSKIFQIVIINAAYTVHCTRNKKQCRMSTSSEIDPHSRGLLSVLGLSKNNTVSTLDSKLWDQAILGPLFQIWIRPNPNDFFLILALVYAQNYRHRVYKNHKDLRFFSQKLNLFQWNIYWSVYCR